MGAGDAEAFGEPDAVAPEVAASSVQAAAIVTNTAATSQHVRTPRDTPAGHLELDTRRSGTLSSGLVGSNSGNPTIDFCRTHTVRNDLGTR